MGRGLKLEVSNWCFIPQDLKIMCRFPLTKVSVEPSQEKLQWWISTGLKSPSWDFIIISCGWLHLRAGYKGRITVWSWTVAVNMSQNVRKWVVRSWRPFWSEHTQLAQTADIRAHQGYWVGQWSFLASFQQGCSSGRSSSQDVFKSKPGKSSLGNVSKILLGLVVTQSGLTQCRHNLQNEDVTLSHVSGLTNAVKLHQVLSSWCIEIK